MRVKLGEICTIKSSKRIFEKEYVDVGVPFIRGQEISDGSIKEINTKFQCYISRERFEQLKNTNGVPKINDILITAVGTIGNLFFVDRNFDFYFKDGNVIWLTDFNEKVNAKYLYFFMKSKYFFKQLECAMIGAVQKALTMVMLSKIEFELPNYNEQTRIANLLERIENKIDNNNKITTELEQMAKTIYDYWFLQYEFPNEEGKPYKSSGGKMLWNDELKKEIPENWTVQRINGIAKLLAGGDKPKEFSSLKNNNYKVPIYANSNENRGLYGYTIEPIIKQNSITVTARGNIGYAILRTKPYVPIIRLISIIPNQNNYLKYLELYINSYNFYKNGSIQQQLTIPQLETLKILCPSDKILNKFENLMSKSVKIVEEKLEENEELTKLRDYLLPLLMNGQVSFKD